MTKNSTSPPSRFEKNLARLKYKVGTHRQIKALREKHGASFMLAIWATGGVGDHLLTARFIRDLQAQSGPFTFDVFTFKPALSNWLFSNVPGFRTSIKADGRRTGKFMTRVLKLYDLELYVCGFASVRQQRITDAFVHMNEKFKSAIDSIKAQAKNIPQIINNHPALDGYLSQYSVLKGYRRQNFTHHMAGIPYGGDAFDLDTSLTGLNRLELAPQSYVTVHNGYDDDAARHLEPGQVATKVYPFFGEVVDILKRHYPYLKFVQLGVSSSTPLQQADFNLINKTTVQEAAGILANAAFHLDNESGLVHMATALGTRCAVVFGPTPSNYFGYDSNLNIDPPVCGGCFWMEETWMSSCVLGEQKAPCMFRQTPEMVAESIIRHITEPLNLAHQSRRSTASS